MVLCRHMTAIDGAGVHVKFLNVGGDKKQADVPDEKSCAADDAVSAAMQKRTGKAPMPQSRL